ncbi:MAG: ribonuclease Y [Epsilonproteobacteria bacterium]|nr:ribonuclease Y [Campylobacterota bacterium]
MVIEVLVGSGISAIAGFFVAKKIDDAKYDVRIVQAKAKAKVIEHEAQMILKNAKNELAQQELQLKKIFEEEVAKIAREYEKKELLLEQKQKNLDNSILEHKQKEKQLQRELKNIQKEKEHLNKQKAIYEERLKEAQKLLEQGAGLTQEEAKKLLLDQTKQEIKVEMAHIVRKAVTQAQKNAKKEANWVIAQATTRYAGEFAGERLINVIHIPDDEIKGRIIGKDGKNIKSLESTLGVDIIVDDTPNVITVSHFNIYRRQIAVEVINRLVEDGRIHPARIEEVYQKVSQEFEAKVLEEGERVILELGLANCGIATELVKLVGKLKFRASYGQNALGHSIEVAHLSGIMAAELGGDELLAKRAGLLHDIGKALTNDYEGSHVSLGYEIANRYNEPAEVLNAIKAHHGEEEAKSIEAAVVCTADTLSAARPGARREVLESFLKRVQGIEEIAYSFEHVKLAYAINAAREVRVIVEAEYVNDDEAVLMSKEIAQEISQKISFPGEIKVMVIRELRAIEYAS